MQHPCGGLIPVLVAVDCSAVSDIQILQIGKMFLIKITDLFKNTASVDGSSAAGGKYSGRSVVFIRRFSLSPRICPAQCAVTVSGIIQQFRLVPHEHSGTDGKHFFLRFNRIIQSPDKSGFCFCVIIQQDHIGRLCFLNAQIHRMTKTGISRQSYHPHFAIRLFFLSLRGLCFRAPSL